jgi:hypothetical protein
LSEADAKDIINGPDFHQSHKVFSAVTTDLKKEGKGGISSSVVMYTYILQLESEVAAKSDNFSS